MKEKLEKTIVGDVHPAVLAYTAGDDIHLDARLVEADCLGTAAHVTMLSRMPVKPSILKVSEAKAVRAELCKIIKSARKGQFSITLEDQDVHLAVEKRLTKKLGDVGKRVHTARSRNDQVALDLRLFGRHQILSVAESAQDVISVLLKFSRKHQKVPMVGRTHMQPAMPSSVGLWSSSYAEGLLEDLQLLQTVYKLTNRSPLGSAAGYGVPLPIDRQLVSDLLGFDGPIHNVIHAGSTRGKLEYSVLTAMSHIMLTLSRLAQDLMLFTMPEFGYFSLPSSCCTGSSIMPQKRNPDVLEILRSRASRVNADAMAVYDMLRAMPSGYNRDIQESKEPYMRGFDTTDSSLQVIKLLVEGLDVHRDALDRGFTGPVFATDRAIELVAGGVPFRDAYNDVKSNLEQLEEVDPAEALAKKTHLGASMGIDWKEYASRLKIQQAWTRKQRGQIHRSMTKLLDLPYPELK
jgi:argininosuccinate lyase